MGPVESSELGDELVNLNPRSVAERRADEALAHPGFAFLSPSTAQASKSPAVSMGTAWPQGTSWM